MSLRGVGMRKLVLVGAGGVVWACATANESSPDDGTRTPTAARGGRAGSSSQAGTSAQSGSGGTLAQGGTGGSNGATGGSSGSSSGGSAGSAAAAGGTGGNAGNNAAGGTTGMAGTSASGGSTATGGTMAMGGANATGGTSAAGGVSTAGMGGTSGVAGSLPNAGTGGMPIDPNWMPPADMEETAKLVVLYQAGQTASMSSNIQMTLFLRNQTDAAYDLADVTIRYWMSSEPSPQPRTYSASQSLSSAGDPDFVPNMANSYLEFSFRAGGTLPVYVDQNSLNNARIDAGVQTSTPNTRFNQANDWSFNSGTTSRANPKITVYDGDTLIWGCEPSRVCAEPEEPPPGGEGGAGGQVGG